MIGAFFILGAARSIIHSSTKISHQSYPEVGDEIVITFPSWVSEKRAKKSFTITPTLKGSLVWINDFHELHFLPHLGFKPNTPYTVSVNVLSFGLASILPLSKTQPIIVKEFTALSDTAPPPLITDGKYIDVNLETMTLALFKNGTIIKTYPIAGKGNPETSPTIEGTFTIKTKEPMHFSSLSHVWMPLSMQFQGNYFIHEWPYWPNGEKLQSRFSAGCVRLHEGHSKEVFDFAEIGMPFIIHSTPLTDPDLIEDGDLVREESDSFLYLVKHIGPKRFKRQVFIEKFEEWYPSLAPLSKNIKIVPRGTLVIYTTSRWARRANPDTKGQWNIYEIDPLWSKHRMRCGGFADCNHAWRLYGWDPDEIYTVTEDELNYYPTGKDFTLRPAPHIIQ